MVIQTGPGVVRVKMAFARQEISHSRRTTSMSVRHIKRDHMNYIYSYGSCQLVQRLQEDPRVGLLVQGIMSAREAAEFGGLAV